MQKRIKCLTPSQLSYLLLVSSVVTGCTQHVERLPDYKEAVEVCQKSPEHCKESDSANNQVGANGTWGNGNYYHSDNSLLNYYLLYHVLFSNNYNPSYQQSYQNRFSNFSQIGSDRQKYAGRGVYASGFVPRMYTAVSQGKVAFETSTGTVFKSASLAGKSVSSVTGKAISRGGFGSSSRGGSAS